MAGVKGREAKTSPGEESFLGGCQVKQKVDIALRSGPCDHHTPKIMAAPLHVAQGKWQLIYPGWEQHAGQHREKRLKNHLETQAAEV